MSNSRARGGSTPSWRARTASSPRWSTRPSCPADGHREQWRRARNHICQEAEQFAASARKELEERSANANGGAIEEIGQAVAKALEDGRSLEPLARATEVMAYQLGEGIQIS